MVARQVDYIAGCGMFYDAVENETLCHNGDPRLTDPALTTGRRASGSAWMWNLRTATDTTPLVAATLAHWGAVTLRTPSPAIH